MDSAIVRTTYETALWMKGAGELAALIRTREVSAREVIDAHLARIDDVNPQVNAITTILADEAREAAAAVDRAVVSGATLGPLAGVPFTVKENVDVAGSATSWGVAAMSGQIASVDAPIVARLREAGAIPIGRTNLPDFALRWDTKSSRGGRTQNPWDSGRTAGGSSGGEAVALATGMTPLGVGNDLGGSLRVPSQMCGTAALKPTRGRVADAAVTQPVPTLAMQVTQTQGPMARRVADLRLALHVVSLPDVRDPRWVPAPLDGPGGDGIRVAVVRDPLGSGVDPHVRAGLDRAVDWLADAGYAIVEAEPPLVAEAVHAWVDALYADLAQVWSQMEPLVDPELSSFFSLCVSHGIFRPVDQARQMATWVAVHEIGAAWAAFLESHPLVVSPVCCERPWAIGDELARTPEIVNAMRMVMPVNILGLPSCAVPVGCDEGLPQGVQVIGRHFREDLILDAAQAIEYRAPRLTPIEPRRGTA